MSCIGWGYMGGIERRQTNGQDYGTDILNLYMIYT